jgi:hypothetical protein
LRLADLSRYARNFLEMNMKQSMVSVFVVLLLGYQLASAQQTQIPWLIGRWDGNIEGFTGKGEPARMLRVNNISAEGAIVSLFGIPPQRRGRAEVKLDGSQVKIFVPSSKTTLELVRESDDVLGGKIVIANGREFPIKLMKTKLSNQFDGKYSGTSSTGQGCGSAHYEIAVKDSLMTGWFRFHVTKGSIAPRTSADGEITGEVSTDGTALIELRGPRNSQFSGMFTANELKAIDPALGNRGCSYELILKRS